MNHSRKLYFQQVTTIIMEIHLRDIRTCYHKHKIHF